VSVENRMPTAVAGKPAIRLVVTVTLIDVRFRFVIVGVLHQGHIFQIRGWGRADKADASMIDDVLKAFEILDGEIVGRVTEREVVDTIGVGWQIEGGVYSSAVSGVTIDPPDGWHLAVGSELELMNPEADIGVVSARPEAYVAVISEAAPPSNREQFAAHLREQVAANLGVPTPVASVERTVFGKPWSLSRYEAKSMDFLHGVEVDEHHAIQVLAWHYKGLRERADAPVTKVLASIQRLDPSQRASLRAALASRTPEQFGVGIGWSVRGSVYRDFAHALTFTAPEGAFWTLAGGEAARNLHAEAVLALEEKEHGIFGVLVTGEAEGGDANEWHTRVVEMWEAKSEERGELALGRHRAITTRVAGEIGGAPYEWSMITTTERTLGVALVFWGPAPLRGRVGEMLDDAARGLEIVDELPETTHEGRYTDHRFGLSFTPPPGFTLDDQTASPLGRSIVSTKGKTVVSIQVIHVQQPQGSDWMERFLEQSLRDRFSEVLAAGPPDRTTTQIAGRPARRMTWTKLLETLDAYTFAKGQRIFAITLANADTALTRQLLTSIEILD
jgi:hypothetical protein